MIIINLSKYLFYNISGVQDLLNMGIFHYINIYSYYDILLNIIYISQCYHLLKNQYIYNINIKQIKEFKDDNKQPKKQKCRQYKFK